MTSRSIGGVGEDIRELYISPQVNAKLNSKHHVSADDVVSACWRVIRSYWVSDPEKGRRLYVQGYTDHGKVILVVLYPGGQPGLWNVATARRR